MWYVICAAGPSHSLQSKYSSLIGFRAQVMSDVTLSILLSMYWQWRPAPHCWGDLEWGYRWVCPLPMSGEWKHHPYRAWLWGRALANLWTRGWAHPGHHWQGVLLLTGDLWYVLSRSWTISSCHETCVFTTVVKKWVCIIKKNASLRQQRRFSHKFHLHFLKASFASLWFCWFCDYTCKTLPISS